MSCDARDGMGVGVGLGREVEGKGEGMAPKVDGAWTEDEARCVKVEGIGRDWMGPTTTTLDVGVEKGVSPMGKGVEVGTLGVEREVVEEGTEVSKVGGGKGVDDEGEVKVEVPASEVVGDEPDRWARDEASER